MLCPEVVGQGLNVSLAEEALLASAAAGRTGQDVGVGCFGPPDLTVKNAGKQYEHIYEHYST